MQFKLNSTPIQLAQLREIQQMKPGLAGALNLPPRARLRYGRADAAGFDAERQHRGHGHDAEWQTGGRHHGYSRDARLRSCSSS